MVAAGKGPAKSWYHKHAIACSPAFMGSCCYFNLPRRSLVLDGSFDLCALVFAADLLVRGTTSLLPASPPALRPAPIFPSSPCARVQEYLSDTLDLEFCQPQSPISSAQPAPIYLLITSTSPSAHFTYEKPA